MSEGLHDSIQANENLKTVVIEEENPQSGRSGRIALIVVLILLLLLALGAAVALFVLTGGSTSGHTNAGITWIRSIYGFGPEQQQRHFPGDAQPAVRGSRIYVADQYNMRILEYDHNGVLRASFGSPGETPYPSNLAIADNGDIYIAQQTHNVISIYDSNHTHIGSIDLPQEPMAIAVNHDMLLVGMRGTFGAFELDGTEIGYVGTHGKGENQFDNISGVALDDKNNAYIVDTFNNRISKYNEAGELTWVVPTGVPRNEGLNIGMVQDREAAQELFPANMQMPMGATIDGAHRLIVIDMQDFTISAFDTDTGEFIDKWGTYGEADGYLYYPNQIEYNRQQDVFYVIETSLGRVQIVKLPDSGGNLLSDLNRGLGGPLGACCLPLVLILIIASAYYIARKVMGRRNKEDYEVIGELTDKIDTKEV